MTVDRSVDILLVEDNPADVELALHAFEMSKMVNRVHVARDGAEALDYLLGASPEGTGLVHHFPRLVLLDLKLPKISGIEVLRRIRETPRTHKIPVVALTSSHEERDISAAYDLGVNSYIVKPVDFEHFNDIVRKLGFYWLLVNQPPP